MSATRPNVSDVWFSVTDLDEGNRSTGNLNFTPGPGSSREPR